MNKKEFSNLKTGEVVIITVHGKNFGKQGIVEAIHYNRNNEGGRAYLRPLNCIFEFSKSVNSVRISDNGLCRFGHSNISYLNKTPNVTKPKLQIYRFTLYLDCDDMVFCSAISTNETDAHRFIFKELIKKFEEDDICLVFKDILPITEGTII